MPYPGLDRFEVRMEPLAARENRKFIEQDHVPPTSSPRPLSSAAQAVMDELALRIQTARDRNRAVMVAFGAHAIKNGLGPVLLQLLKHGWITHLATNGAGIIHDWEFAFQGKSCEQVGPMVAQGRFGNWQETGFYLNLALNVGAYEGRGYGEAVGALIQQEGLSIPRPKELEAVVHQELFDSPFRAAAAADLLGVVRRFELDSGWMAIPHPWKQYSVQAGCLRCSSALHRAPDDWT